jgi:opacity protein-like surface antigen
MRQSKNSFILIVFICVLLPNLAMADAWFYKPIFWTQGLGDTNRQLRSSDEKGTVGVNGRAGLELSRQSDTSDIYLRGILNSARYDGSEVRGRDYDNQLFYTGGNWRGERSNFTIDGNYLRQDTSVTELEDSGFVSSNDRRIDASIRSQYSYLLFEDTQVFIGGSYTDVEFPNVTPTNLTEYEVTGANGGISYSISELNSITLTTYYSDYEAQTFTSDVESIGGNVRYSRIFNEQWQAYLGLGYRKSNVKFINTFGNIERDSETGETYELGVTYEQSEVDTFNFSVANELSPSSTGDVNERLAVRLDYLKQLSPRFNGVADFLWQETESVNAEDDSNNREYWQSSIGIDYRLTESWYLTSRYRHRFQEFVDRDNSSKADSDAILIGIRFGGKDKRI